MSNNGRKNITETVKERFKLFQVNMYIFRRIHTYTNTNYDIKTENLITYRKLT